MAVDLEILKQTLLNSFKDAKVELIDEAGDGNHLFLHIITEEFKELSKLNRHKLIYDVLKEHMPYIHALSIKAETINGD